MKAGATIIEDKVDELVAILNKDVEHIQQSLSYLNELRSHIIKRDDAALSKLLETIQTGLDDYRIHELKRRKIREELAEALGCNFKQVTLSMLGTVLSEERKAQIAQIKTKLGSLVKELRREHLSTVLLLSECARFNRLLLRSIFDLEKTGVVTYDSNGAARQPRQVVDAAFLNLKL